MSNTLDLGTLVARIGTDLTDLVKGLGDADSKLAGWAKGAGKVAAAGGLAAGALFAAGMVKSLDVEKATDKMAARLGLNAKQNARMGKLAGDLYADAYGASVEETATALSAVTSSVKGMRRASDEELKAAAATAMDYANVFGVDVTEAANTAGQLIKNGLAKDATEAFDLMTAGAQKMPDAMKGELGPIMDEYGKDFAALGLSGEQAMAMLVAKSKGGAVQMDKLGDSLKEFKLLATDEASVEILDGMGLDARALSNDLLAGGDKAKAAMKTMAQGILAIKDPTEQSAAAVALFGTPLEDMGKESSKVRAFMESLAGGKGMGGVEGAAKRMSKTVNDNAATSIEELKRSAEMMVLGLANKVIPKVQEFAQFLKTNFGPAVKAVAGFLGEHTTALKVAAVAIGALIVVTKVHAAVMAVQAAGGLMAMVKGLKVVSAVTKSYTAVQWLLNAAMSANPVGLVILAIAGLVAILVIAWKKSETFRRIVTGAFEAVKSGASAAFGWLKKNWPLVLAILTGPIGLAVLVITKNMDKIKAGVTKAKDWIVAKFTRVLDFITGLKGKVAEKASGMWDGIQDAFKGMLNRIIGFWNNLSFGWDKIEIKGAPDIPAFNFDTPNIPELAKGGYVPATPGGQIVKVAEAGKPEIVSPVDTMVGAVKQALAETSVSDGGQKQVRIVNWRDGLGYLEEVAGSVVNADSQYAAGRARAGAFA